MKRRTRNVKLIFPSTITTFSMVFGFIAILLATNNQITKAGYLLMIAILMDGLDGKLARMTNAASDFGIQYDSLADMVAFGVAPCVIYSRFYLHQQVTDQVYYLVPIMYLTCGAIRLARFNVTASIYGKTHFTGLPIPAAAFMVSTGPIFYQWAVKHPFFKEWGLLPYLSHENYFQGSIAIVIALSMSMISTVKFDTPTSFWFRKFQWKPLNYLVILFFLSLNLIHYALFATAISVYYMVFNYGRALYEKIRKTEHANSEPEPV